VMKSRSFGLRPGCTFSGLNETFQCTEGFTSDLLDDQTQAAFKGR